MERTAIIEDSNSIRRMVVLEDGLPVELLIESPEGQSTVGNLYMGRVMNVLPGMQAAFIDIGAEKNAFLPLADVPDMYQALSQSTRDGLRKRTLRPGDEVLVQVLKDGAGEKGARLTMHPSFPGKYAVLLPAAGGVGISRHITDVETRESLLRVAEDALPGLSGMGVIIRTAALDAPSLMAIREEIGALHAAWLELSAKAGARKAPALVYSGGGLLERASRDLNAQIVRGEIPQAILAKIDKALRRKVWLNSGAYLVVDPCEAMTVIDVNSGKYTGKKSLSDTLLRVNIEAAREIAYQIRLRDISGIIIVDFADMDSDEDREAVLSAFHAAMASDRAKRHVHGFTAAGLLEMTRRAVYQPLRQALYKECPACHGEGVIRARTEA